MQVKLLMLAIVLVSCGCSDSPAPNPDTGFYEASFGEGSSIKAKRILQIGAAHYWIIEVANENKRTTLLRCAGCDGHTMTVLSSEEVQAEKSSEKRISDNYIRDYGEKNGR